MPVTPEPPEQDGISLEELREAFAQAVEGQSRTTADDTGGRTDIEPAADGRRHELDERPAPAQLKADDGPAPENVSNDDCCPISPSSILEAMLFVGNRNNEPLTAARAAELMRGVEPSEIPGLVEALNRTYEAGRYAFRIMSEGAGYRLALAEEHFAVRDRFFGRVREARLSQAAVDVLAIVAYQQPLTGDDVSRLRGTPSGHILSQLVRRRLLRIERTEAKPRTTRYFTTDRFLELFKLNSLEDLPQSDELERR